MFKKIRYWEFKHCLADILKKIRYNNTEYVILKDKDLIPIAIIRGVTEEDLKLIEKENININT